MPKWLSEATIQRTVNPMTKTKLCACLGCGSLWVLSR